MQNIYKKIEPLSYYTALGVFIALSLLHVLTGYADNGDFLRSVGFLFERPDGFSAMSPAAESEEWSRRYYSSWHDKWVFLPSYPNTEYSFSFSSYTLYLLFQAHLSTLISGENLYYSVISGSILSRLILCMIFLAVAHHIRRQLSNLPAWIFAILFGFVLIDSTWIAFLNSFYQEQIAIIFLSVFGFLLLKFHTNQSAKTGFWLVLSATFIGSAKTAYFYLPILSLFFLAPLLSSKKVLIKLTSITILLQLVSMSPVYFGKYEKINSYHALYFGALKVLSKSEAASIQSISGKPILHECIGVSAFYLMGEKCVEISKASYSDVVKLIGSHPAVGVRMLFKLLEEGRATRIEDLGRGIENSPNFSGYPVFNLWPKFFARGLNYFMLLVLLSSVFLLIAKKSLINDKEKSTLLVGVFFAAFGFSQYIVALGDGYYEITKHLAIGNYALALSLPFTFAAIVSVAQRLLLQKATLRNRHQDRTAE